ncbi:MAG: cupredoxin domain-containing protein [Candidatus Blackburnbacteria bacterium]|nr:cupredoxin domain-containing protein [Candidatus Blackburnbacteria bacterium]
MSRSGLVILGALIVLGVVLAEGLKFTNSSATRNSDTNSSQTAKGQDQTSDNKIEVAAGEYTFSPQTISLKKGVLTEIVLKNTGNGIHNLVIPDLSVETESIGHGEETSVEVTPDKEGEFNFSCSISNHKELGMEGTIKVTQ